MFRPFISHFLQTSDLQSLSANLKETKQGQLHFLRHGVYAETLQLCAEALPRRSRHCSSMAKTINMLQCLRQESLSYRWIKQSRCFESCPLPPPRILKLHAIFGAFSNHLVKTPGLSQLLLPDIAMGEYYILFIRALI